MGVLLCGVAISVPMLHLIARFRFAFSVQSKDGWRRAGRVVVFPVGVFFCTRRDSVAE